MYVWVLEVAVRIEMLKRQNIEATKLTEWSNSVICGEF